MHKHQMTTAQAWASFYITNRQALVTYALSLTGDEHEAEDLIQNVLMRLVQQGRLVDNPRSYVLRCMRNLRIDQYRSAGRQVETVPLDNEGIAIIDTDLQDPADQEKMHHLAEALKSLKPHEREVIMLKVYSGQSFKEITAILDQPMGTVTSRYTRGMNRLREWYGREPDHE